MAGVEVGLFFMEQPRGGVKVSFRSRSRVDVARRGRAVRRRRPSPRLRRHPRNLPRRGPLPRPRRCRRRLDASLDPACRSSCHVETPSKTIPDRITLRRLPLAARLVLAVFLISVGLGYISAMVQLHFQHSSRDGSPLPGPKETIKVFHGETGPLVSTLQRLIEAPPDGFKGGPNGTMSKAFFKQGFRARDMREDREGERQAVLAWIKAGTPRKPYEQGRIPDPRWEGTGADHSQVTRQKRHGK